MTWIKICGTTSLRDAQLSVDAGADALGFIFAPSPRHVEVETAAGIVAALPPAIETIGVFVNETPERIAEVADRVSLSGVQLQGDEPAEQLGEFRRTIGRRKIIKGLAAAALTVERIESYLRLPNDIDAILLDSGSAKQRGGTGVPFDWERARALAGEIRAAMPLIIAGGLNCDNVGQAIQFFAPWGVDVVSGVERATGTKDREKLRAFIAAAR